jgi:hypothetical protein
MVLANILESLAHQVRHAQDAIGDEAARFPAPQRRMHGKRKLEVANEDSSMQNVIQRCAETAVPPHHGIYSNPVLRPSEDIRVMVAPAKRTRMTMKGTLPRSYYEEVLYKLQKVDLTWQLKRVAMNFFIAYHRRKEYYEMRAAEDKCISEEALEEEGVVRKRPPLIIEFRNTQRFQTMWQDLHAGQQALWFLAASEGRSYLDPELLGPSTEAIADRLCSRAVLATFHGDWGFHLPEVQDLLASNLPHDMWPDKLRQIPFYKDLAEKFHTYMISTGERIGFTAVSTSLEYCDHQAELCRVHLHVYMSAKDRSTVIRRGFLKKILQFEGVTPAHMVMGWEDEGKATTACRYRQNEGHFYLQYEKVGSVYRASNFQKHQDFAVPPRFIKNQLSRGKMELKVAMREAMLSKQNVRSAHVEYEFQRFLTLQLKNDDLAAEVTSMLNEHRRQFIPSPEPVLEWMSQYSTANWGRMARFKVLVLDGPSRTGKTSWAQSFFGLASTFVIDCQNKDTPALREYALQGREKFKAIVFDEGNWQLIHNNKKLFQAGNEPITMAQSPTQQFTYSLWAYSVPMIVCSNNFWTDCTAEAEEYLNANIVYVPVNARVYVD